MEWSRIGFAPVLKQRYQTLPTSIMEIVEVVSDFKFTEADLRKFFSFCGEIATIELLFKPEDANAEYKAELTFSSGTNSALLLDRSTFDGHLVRVSLK